MQTHYDIIIIGGGLAGLCAAKLLAQKNYSVLLLEKESYPQHKVCGEYISMESWNFLTQQIGVNLDKLHLPKIKKLRVTGTNGVQLNSVLPLGGFGISRYKLDNLLYENTKLTGVNILQHCKAENINFENEIFTVETNLQTFTAKICLASWGKRSNIDVKWKRYFTLKKSDRLNNYVGVKYHIETNLPNDLITLHNFKNGYCGVSQIEANKFCLCYLTKASNLKIAGSITNMEQEILSENPYLKKLLAESNKLSSFPLSISQVSFSPKNCVENNVLMLGDAAGMITPLCGNGMSIAMHTAKIAAENVHLFLAEKYSRFQMEKAFTQSWQKHFAKRIKVGRMVQTVFGQKSMTNIFIYIMKLFPSLTRFLIKQTHGKPF
jgi:menaquinone-9 beta-reductase